VNVLFETVTRRFVLRLLVAGLAAGIAVLVGADGAITESVLLGAASAAFYAIIGGLTPVEPRVGIKYDRD
jgi:hypothetical protein